MPVLNFYQNGKLCAELTLQDEPGIKLFPGYLSLDFLMVDFRKRK